MIPIDSVTINWAEGPTLLVEHFPVAYATLDEANKALLPLWHRAPDLGCYKVNFTIRWTDGETYTGRLEIESDSGLPDIGAHVQRMVAFYSGESRPAHLDETTYRRLVARSEPEAWRDLRERYDIGAVI